MEQSNFKDKGVMELPPPPQCFDETKKPSAYRVKEVILKLQNNSAAGKDLVVLLWIKKIYVLHQPIINIFEEMKSGKEEMSELIDRN